jgi:glutamate N-acetyltransferase/amino-acid N-acetyltransferase
VLLAKRGLASRDSTRDQQLADALEEVCASLARQIVADGEGATVVLEIVVRRASSDEEARAIALRVATSPLVKTAAFGRDPNWGRVLAAAGSAPWNGGFAQLDQNRLRVSFDGTTVFEEGAPTGLVPTLGGADARIELDLGLGAGECAYLASDLSYDYVRLNAEYTT